jgi:hypothetical protein
LRTRQKEFDFRHHVGYPGRKALPEEYGKEDPVGELSSKQLTVARMQCHTSISTSWLIY